MVSLDLAGGRLLLMPIEFHHIHAPGLQRYTLLNAPKKNIWVVCQYLFDEFNLVLKGDGIYSLGLADGSARVHHCLLCCDAATGTKWHMPHFSRHMPKRTRQMIRHDSAYGIFLPLAQCFCFIFASLTEGKERPWMFWSHLDVRYALLGDALLKRLTDTRAAANGKKE